MHLRNVVGYGGAVLVAALLILFGVTWLLTPSDNALVFGVPLDGLQLAYGRVKGAQDVLVGVILATFLWLDDRRALRLMLLACLIVPFGDALAIVSVGLIKLSAIAIHVGFVVVMVLSAALITDHQEKLS